MAVVTADQDTGMRTLAKLSALIPAKVVARSSADKERALGTAIDHGDFSIAVTDDDDEVVVVVVVGVVVVVVVVVVVGVVVVVVVVAGFRAPAATGSVDTAVVTTTGLAIPSTSSIANCTDDLFTPVAG